VLEFRNSILIVGAGFLSRLVRSGSKERVVKVIHLASLLSMIMPEPSAADFKRSFESFGVPVDQGLDRLWLSLHLLLLLMTPCVAWASVPLTKSKQTWKSTVRISDTSGLVPVAHTNARQGTGNGRLMRLVSTVSDPTSSNSDRSEDQEPHGDRANPNDCSCSPLETSTQLQVVDPNLSEVWEISSRHLPEKFRCIDPLRPGLKAQRYTQGSWQPDELENALVHDGRLVIVYVHGNFMERENALERELILNEYIRRRAQRPYRLLMLSWPSAREPHPLRDVLENADSAECQGLFVGWLLERLGQDTEVSLLGFSFGARAVTGGLHFASGGTVPGYHYNSISGPIVAENKYRVALVAPALDRDWISSGGKHARGMENVSGLVNLYNSKDPILRRFRFIDRLSRPVAAGFAGFIGIQSFENVSNPKATEPLMNSTKIRQFDCGSGIGTTHSERSYYAQCPYFQLVVDHLLGQESNANPIE